MSRRILRRLVGSAVVAILAASGAAVFATAASAATVPVPTSCTRHLHDEVGLARNMLAAARARNFPLFQLNSEASITIDPSADCAPVLSQAADQRVFAADEDLPVAETLIHDGSVADHATAIQKLHQAISIFESIQAKLGLRVGGHVPEPTPPNPNVPPACVTALEVWLGDSNNMLTAAENHDVTTMENNLTVVQEFGAPADCASQLTGTQDAHLADALNHLVTATNVAKKNNFSRAATNVSIAKTIVTNTQHKLGLFIKI